MVQCLLLCEVVFCYFKHSLYCFQAATTESSESAEKHVKVECDEQALNSARQNLFSNMDTNCVDGTVPPDNSHLLLPKLEHKHVISNSAANSDIYSREWTGCSVSTADNVWSVIVTLPLIARLRRIKQETPDLCVKTEVADSAGDAVDTAAGEQAVQSATSDAQTTEEAETDVKKEASAAAKGLQLARETIANIFGTEVQPPSRLKIPIKRRAERDSDECNDAKRPRTSSRNDDVYDRSASRQRSWYVLE